MDETVFINTEFIIDIFYKGSFDTTVLLTYFEQSDNFDKQTGKMWLRRIQRISIYGILQRAYSSPLSRRCYGSEQAVLGMVAQTGSRSEWTVVKGSGVE